MNPAETPRAEIEPKPGLFAEFRADSELRLLTVGGPLYAAGMLILSVSWKLGGGSSKASAWEFAPEAFILFCSVLVLLCLLNSLTVSRHRIVVCNRGITLQKTFGRTFLPSNSIRHVRWICFPRWGSVRLESGTQKMKIEFGLLCSEDRFRLLAILREALPTAAEENWERFELNIVRQEWPKGTSILDCG